jgi:hypothetical protein
MGFLAARWKSGAVSEHLDDGGWAGASSAPGSSGFWSAAISTPPIYGDRGPGAGVRPVSRWFRGEGLLLGWAAGIGWGSWTAWSNGLKPLATLAYDGTSYTFYVGLGALLLNIAVAAIVTLIVRSISRETTGAAAPS